jgi:hypothetical protein
MCSRRRARRRLSSRCMHADCHRCMRADCHRCMHAEGQRCMHAVMAGSPRAVGHTCGHPPPRGLLRSAALRRRRRAHA